jgi:hypothetical protein
MKGNGNDLPRLAMWLLKHACPGSDREALTGDVVEEFCTGRSPAWLWKQVLVAIAITVPTRIRRNWPLISYALAGAAITLATSNNYYLRAQGARQVVCVNGLVFSLRRRLSGRWESGNPGFGFPLFHGPHKFFVLVFGFKIYW